MSINATGVPWASGHSGGDIVYRDSIGSTSECIGNRDLGILGVTGLEKNVKKFLRSACGVCMLWWWRLLQGLKMIYVKMLLHKRSYWGFFGLLITQILMTLSAGSWENWTGKRYLRNNLNIFDVLEHKSQNSPGDGIEIIVSWYPRYTRAIFGHRIRDQRPQNPPVKISSACLR